MEGPSSLVQLTADELMETAEEFRQMAETASTEGRRDAAIRLADRFASLAARLNDDETG